MNPHALQSAGVPSSEPVFGLNPSVDWKRLQQELHVTRLNSTMFQSENWIVTEEEQ